MKIKGKEIAVTLKKSRLISGLALYGSFKKSFSSKVQDYDG